MGAELILAVAYQRHPERTEADLDNLVTDITEDEAVTFWEDYQQIGWDEIGYFDSKTEVKERVQEMIRSALLNVSNQFVRDVMVIEDLEGHLIALGGGTSHGDTEPGFDEIAVLEAWGQW